MKMPVFFVGHGSPMNIISTNDFTQSLQNVSKIIKKPEAILAISAHWLTQGTSITGFETPETIYDFYGFPQQLYRIKYPCKGASELAQKIKNEVPEISIDVQYGLDHAVWSVLVHMYPNADIPVIAMSVDVSKSYHEHYKLAQKLKFLREQNVLIIASGNIVHNLQQLDFSSVNAPVFAWADRFSRFIEKALSERNTEEILDPFKYSSDAALAIPSDDHYVPMLYFAGLLLETEKVNITHKGIQHGSVSMLSCLSEIKNT